MKQSIMKKWVRALRSGKYKQGKGTLKQYNRKGEAEHCCLGVLCELYNQQMRKNKKKTLTETTHENNSDFTCGYTRFGGRCDDLPKIVREWSGMKTGIGIIDENKKDNNLVDFNDSGYSFKNIAYIIEQNWEKL